MDEQVKSWTIAICAVMFALAGFITVMFMLPSAEKRCGEKCGAQGYTYQSGNAGGICNCGPGK